MWLFNSATTSFLIAFPALFSMVNPIGISLIYHQVTAGRSRAQRTVLAWRVAAYSLGVMLVSLWIGATLIGFFGVSLSALRIAGGLVVAARAWEMLSAPEQSEGRKQEQASNATGASDDAFFPLTMPLTTGPGTISVAIALSASRPKGTLDVIPYMTGMSVAALVVALTIGFFYASADRVVSLLGRSGSRVVTRMSAFLLLCIGVQICLTGVQEALISVIPGRFMPSNV